MAENTETNPFWPTGIEEWATNTVAGIQSLASPWTLLQLAVLVTALLGSLALARWLTPPLEQRLRAIEGQPLLLRILVLFLRRLRWIILALLLWSISLLLAAARIPEGGVLISTAASLVTAWVIISIVSRLIRNQLLAAVVAALVWSVVALSILGLLPQTLALLDQAAFSVGDFRLSLLTAIKAVLFVAVLLWLARVAADFIERRIKSESDLSPTALVLIGKAVKGVLFVGAFLMALSLLGIDLSALAIFSGALGLGIGFGLQKVASNLVSGIIILLDKSIKPGDVIGLGDTIGWISELKARYVSVVTRDGIEYLIPNETFVTDRVINWSHTNRVVRLEIKFGAGYDSDPHAVRKMAVEAVEKLERVVDSRPPVCHLVGFGESSLDFVLRFWIQDPEAGLVNIRGQVLLAIWDTFKKNGIRIPYPHREVFVHGARPVTGVTGS